MNDLPSPPTFREAFKRRAWVIGLCTVISTLCGTWHTYHQPDLFMSKGSLMAAPPKTGNVYPSESINYFDFQEQLMRSKKVMDAARVLGSGFEYLPYPGNPLLTVKRQKGTGIFNLTVISPSAEYSQNFLSQLMYRIQSNADEDKRFYNEFLQEKSERVMIEGMNIPKSLAPEKRLIPLAPEIKSLAPENINIQSRASPAIRIGPNHPGQVVLSALIGLVVGVGITALWSWRSCPAIAK